MMQPAQYILANGYSNMFWGWGREDSDMEYRLSRVAINPIKPYNVDVARYSMIPHVHPWRFQNEKQNLGAATRLTTKVTVRDIPKILQINISLPNFLIKHGFQLSSQVHFI